jgi:anaerobic selenocysteine-containing dehydrogenase
VPIISPSYSYTIKYLNSKTGEEMEQGSKLYIIIGTSGAAQHPVLHRSLQEAEKEANRLAKNKPGEEFTVFSTVKSFRVEEKPVTVKVFV